MIEVCFYCHRDIAANDEVVRGVEQVAHRACVRRRIESSCPEWLETKIGRPATAPVHRKRLVGPTTTKRADPIFGLSANAFRNAPKKASKTKKRAALRLLAP
jgi:hypothetical protein